MTKPNEFPVKIHVVTTHELEEQIEDYEENFEGGIIKIGNNFYLRYQENIENEEAAVTLKIDDQGPIQLTRKTKEQRLHLKFVSNERTMAQYKVSYGNIPLIVFTSQLDFQIECEPLVGVINIDYQLFNGEVSLGKYKIRLQFMA